MLLSKMQEEGFPFCRVVGLSGSGQQHGSVYWREGAGEILTHLQPSLSLHEQLKVKYDCCKQESSTLSLTGLILPGPEPRVEGLQYKSAVQRAGGGSWRSSLSSTRDWVPGLRGEAGRDGLADVLLPLKRFTGNQIAKIFQRKEGVEAYKEFDSTEVSGVW